MEENETGQEVAEGQTDETEEETTEEPAEGAEAATTEEPRQTRRERQKTRRAEHENKIRQQVSSEYMGRIAELEGRLADALGEVGKSTTKMTEVVDRITTPKEEPLRDRMRARAEAAAARIRQDDPASVKAYLDEMNAIAEDIATDRARAIVKEEMANFARNMPKQPSPQNIALLGIASWLGTDDDAREAVETEIRRIARKDRRNMKDPRVRDTTIREAIVRVGRDWDLPVNLAGQDSDTGTNAVVGAGSRTFSGAGGTTPQSLTPLQMALADGHPTYKNLPAEKRYIRFRKEVIEPEIRRQQTG